MRKVSTRILILFTCCLFIGLGSTTVYAELSVPINQEQTPINGQQEQIEQVSEDNLAEEPVEINHHPYFIDVPLNHFAYESIDRLYSLGAINYRVEQQFMPSAPISRAEFVHMLLLAKGLYWVDFDPPSFSDVDMNDAFAPYINIAHRLGIVDGVGNQQFRPGDPVRRDALVKMLTTASGELNVKHILGWQERRDLLANFKDKQSIVEWAEHYFAYAIKNNFVSGYPDQTIRPSQFTTRAEAAVLIDRVILSNNSIQQDSNTISINGVPVAYTKQLTMQATAFNSSETKLSNVTYTGLTTRVGVVAVDRSVIPLGTHLYVEGYGYAVAADIGGAVKGNKIDLYTATLREARTFGRQNVTVYVLP
ncbi:hypothetical protein BHU72_07910 [Desulfuribacillus stibiiarsenatis]|uniref:SLH domain-containing protein n=1 Tax=Desulfuribacillus stibiiarsenatis TaxID=1390249 RepID=A0A1E5L480_9FIRM|nr:S-layer homology domain-containing protein [Desulfuribacillus stibiiarsenatis]OEH84749.1 hypothetical protein BHU72_07910 [Desulfuribacillus stibiiarsenatis]